MQHIGIVPVDAPVSQRYALVRAELERQGITIGSNDFWIAAQALVLNATLVTDNIAEFNRVEGLATDNAKALSHMGIENRHHWVLGVTFREDDDYLTTQTDKC